MKIDKGKAKALLREEAAAADIAASDPAWVAKIEHLSQLCEDGISVTHIAFLGALILAKAVDSRADLYAIKPSRARDNPNAFSARTLCHNALVPLAAELGISIGVTGREPLNNQPYNGMSYLGDNTPIHSGGRAAFNAMLEIVRELQASKTEKEARAALRAFIAVRKRYLPSYGVSEGGITITPEKLNSAVLSFIHENSERGKRAQAIVAGLMDVFAGVERVESGRINDPSRKYPGDVCVRSIASDNKWEKAIEVRDKPVSDTDVQIFANKCIHMGVREAAVVMASEHQEKIDVGALSKWANARGIGLTLFHGWNTFIDQALFWAELPKPDAASKAIYCIRSRLILVEVLPESVTLWDSLTRS